MIEKTIIYIAGYGRSGSTLLERILSSHRRIFGMGEITNFLDLINNGSSFCSCGKQVYQCEFWSDVIKNFSNTFKNLIELKKIQKEFDSISGFINHFFERNSNQKIMYKNLNQKLFYSIFQKLPPETNYLVDSSKTTRQSFFRPISLSRLAFLNLKVIHLVRDGRGCMWSNLKGSNKRLERCKDSYIHFATIRTATSWFLANIAAHIIQATFSPKNYCRIRYEDFVKYPSETMNRLGSFLDINFKIQAEMLKRRKNIPLGHQLAGNRLRSQKQIILKPDIEWRKKLRLYNKLLFWLLDWPLILYYKYYKNKDGSL